MSAMIYENGAWKEAETPKAWNGSAFADTEGYYWENEVQKEGWGAAPKWITNITAKFAGRPLITINGQGNLNITNNGQTVYMKSNIKNTSYGNDTISPVFGFDNNGKYKGITFKVSDLDSHNTSLSLQQPTLLVFTVNSLNGVEEVASTTPRYCENIALNDASYHVAPNGSSITIDFTTGNVTASGYTPRFITNAILNKRYIGFCVIYNGDVSVGSGEWAQVTMYDIGFIK